MIFITIINIFFCFLTVFSKPTVDDTGDVLIYLKRYGYDLSECATGAGCMNEQLTLESMLKSFQVQFGLPMTGQVDAATKQIMNRPRCGLPDRDLSPMNLASYSHDHQKWDKRSLTWSFRGNDKAYRRVIGQAFEKWREIIPQFQFTRVCSTCDADIYLSFQQEKNHLHEKNTPDAGFNPKDLGHGYFPKDGTVHFNSAKKWAHTFDHSRSTFYFYLVAVHEIGHALGYRHNGHTHNNDSSSIMYGIYGNIDKDNLFTEADKQSMRNIYPDVPSSTIDWNEENWAYACDFHEHDYKNEKTLLNECRLTCIVTAGCTHFTWNRHNGGTCWMKSGRATKNDAYLTNDQQRICGIINRKAIDQNIEWNEFHWATGCDFYENNLENRLTSANQCGRTCVKTQGCTHFTWSTYNSGTCWLKTGRVTKDDAFFINDPDMICGIVNSRHMQRQTNQIK